MTDFHLAREFLEEHKDEIKRCGKPIFNGQLTMHFEGGPQKSETFVVNKNDMVFYQPEGDVTIHVKEGDNVRQVVLHQRDVVVLPANVEYRVEREPDTVGSVIEQSQPTAAKQSTKVPDPVHIQTFVEDNLDKINESPQQLFGPPNFNSVLTLYGKGTHNLSSCKANDLILIIQRGTATYVCGETNKECPLQTFHLARVKPGHKFVLHVPEGGVCLTVKIPQCS